VIRKFERYNTESHGRNKNVLKDIATIFKAHPKIMEECTADARAKIRSDLDSATRMAEESERAEKHWQIRDIEMEREIEMLERKVERLRQQQQDQRGCYGVSDRVHPTDGAE
jgi:predicted RNase H-like nuclease (RuvC/YqgF family)